MDKYTISTCIHVVEKTYLYDGPWNFRRITEESILYPWLYGSNEEPFGEKAELLRKGLVQKGAKSLS